jgi:hypothetical protein
VVAVAKSPSLTMSAATGVHAYDIYAGWKRKDLRENVQF